MKGIPEADRQWNLEKGWNLERGTKDIQPGAAWDPIDLKTLFVASPRSGKSKDPILLRTRGMFGERPDLAPRKMFGNNVAAIVAVPISFVVFIGHS